jgi:putative flippase GtrA
MTVKGSPPRERPFARFMVVRPAQLRFARFLLVGGINTLFGYSVYAVALWFGAHYSLAIALSTVLGVLFNFKSTGTLVFRSSDNSLLFRFVLVYAALYAVNVAAVTVLLRLGFSTYQSGLLMVLPLAFLAFSLNTRYVFPAD